MVEKFTYNITKANMSGANLAVGFYTLSNHGAWQPKAEEVELSPRLLILIKCFSCHTMLCLFGSERIKMPQLKKKNKTVTIHKSCHYLEPDIIYTLGKRST